MAKIKVPIFGTIGKAVAVDPRATEGATVGVNLRWPDGTLVQVGDLTGGAQQSDSGGVQPTLWKLVLEKPRNIEEVEALSSAGLIVRLASQDWITRSIVGVAGNITVTSGDGAADNPTIDLADVPDSGAGALLAITRDAKGRVAGTKAATIAGTAGRITVTNGDAAAGLPTIDLAQQIQDLLAALDAVVPGLRASDAGSYRQTSAGYYRVTA